MQAHAARQQVGRNAEIPSSHLGAAFRPSRPERTSGRMVMTDRITETLCAELRARAAVGRRKYGVTLGDAALTQREVLQHAKEEALDLAAYLQRAIDELDRQAGSFW